MPTRGHAERIVSNLTRVRDTLREAALRAGRPPDAVQLIAVSKTHPALVLETAVAAGQTVFGENTVQEALPKIAALPERGLEWHFIGHLQSNKAKFIPGNFTWVHSLDGLKLAQRLSQAALENHPALQTLIEVNISRDPKKHGVVPEALAPLLEQLLKAELPGISLRGLMAIGPHPASATALRQAFANLRRLRDTCREDFALPGFSELSMGMSGDYIEAIEEGSTMVRVGSAIFGDRIY